MSFVALLTIAFFRQGLSPTCSKFPRRSQSCLFLLVALGLGFVSGCGEDPGADSSTPADLPGQPAVDAAGGEPGEPSRAPALFEPYRAMWVLCEGSQRALEDPARVEARGGPARSGEVNAVGRDHQPPRRQLVANRLNANALALGHSRHFGRYRARSPLGVEAQRFTVFLLNIN